MILALVVTALLGISIGCSYAYAWVEDREWRKTMEEYKRRRAGNADSTRE